MGRILLICVGDRLKIQKGDKGKTQENAWVYHARLQKETAYSNEGKLRRLIYVLLP